VPLRVLPERIRIPRLWWLSMQIGSMCTFPASGMSFGRVSWLAAILFVTNIAIAAIKFVKNSLFPVNVVKMVD